MNVSCWRVELNRLRLKLRHSVGDRIQTLFHNLCLDLDWSNLPVLYTAHVTVMLHFAENIRQNIFFFSKIYVWKFIIGDEAKMHFNPLTTGVENECWLRERTIFGQKFEKMKFSRILKKFWRKLLFWKILKKDCGQDVSYLGLVILFSISDRLISILSKNNRYLYFS